MKLFCLNCELEIHMTSGITYHTESGQVLCNPIAEKSQLLVATALTPEQAQEMLDWLKVNR